MNFEKLRILLIVAFMLVSLVPMTFLGYKVISQGETLIEEKASSYLKGLSKRNAEAIKGFMTERVNDPEEPGEIERVNDLEGLGKIIMRGKPFRPGQYRPTFG